MSKFAKKVDTEVKPDTKAKVSVKVRMPDKPAKPVKAEKAPKKADTDTRKITVLAKENPKRAGSKAHATFELYKKAKTVQAFYDAGGKAADIKYDQKAGHIELA